MPEPLDTIRRVNSGEPMSLAELRKASAVLDRYARSGKTDVLQARRRVASLLEKGAVAGPTAATEPAGGTKSEQKEDPGPLAKVLAFLFLFGVVYFFAWACGFTGGDDSGSDYERPRKSETECAALYLDALSDDSSTSVDSAAKYEVWC